MYYRTSMTVGSTGVVGVGHREFCTEVSCWRTTLQICSAKWGAMGVTSRAALRIQYKTRLACMPIASHLAVRNPDALEIVEPKFQGILVV